MICKMINLECHKFVSFNFYISKYDKHPAANSDIGARYTYPLNQARTSGFPQSRGDRCIDQIWTYSGTGLYQRSRKASRLGTKNVYIWIYDAEKIRTSDLPQSRSNLELPSPMYIQRLNLCFVYMTSFSKSFVAVIVKFVFLILKQL